MKLFLDSADAALIEKYTSLGIVDGITTNPTSVASSPESLRETIGKLCELIDGPVSVEVVHEDLDGMMDDAYEFIRWHKNICIKLPLTEAGLTATRLLAKQRVRTNVTLVFSLSQALLAAKCGATYISPFVGRLDDIQKDGMGLIRDMVQMKRNYSFSAQILVASVRSVRHVEQAALLGADICTIPPALMPQLIDHPLTTAGHQKFLRDFWNRS